MLMQLYCFTHNYDVATVQCDKLNRVDENYHTHSLLNEAKVF